MLETLVYYTGNTMDRLVFSNYTVESNDSGVFIRNKKGKIIKTHKIPSGHNRVTLSLDGKDYTIYVGRIVASTFLGPPETPRHTVDHINNNAPGDDRIENIRWLCKTGQRHNQTRSETYNNAFLIVRNEVEKTSREWETYFKDNPKEREDIPAKSLSKETILNLAIENKYGFSFKVYPDLPGETWFVVPDSFSRYAHWEFSTKCRMARVSSYARNVFSGDRFYLFNDYPTVYFNETHQRCHVIVFKTLFPEEYAARGIKVVCHRDDDKTNFAPDNLYLGTAAENTSDSYKNGKHDGKGSAQRPVVSFVSGVFEKHHDSYADAERYLRELDPVKYSKAACQGIYQAIKSWEEENKIRVKYHRTWLPVESDEYYVARADGTIRMPRT